MASLRNLPVELHYQVLFYLVDIVDQIAAANTCPLWCKILGTKGFFEDRYQTIPRCTPGFPQIHKLLLLSSDRQISCTTRNGSVEAYGIRFLNNQNNHGRDPNSFHSWDISACSFLEEPPFRITGSGTLAEPRDFHPYVEMNTWLPAGYRHYSKLYESKFIRSLVEGFILGVRSQLDNAGLLPDIFQEITIYQFTAYPQDSHPGRIGSFSGCVVRRSGDQYRRWIKCLSKGDNSRQNCDIGDIGLECRTKLRTTCTTAKSYRSCSKIR
ncbi:hypothetical protein TWF132_010243 [Orbilia oligospora]|nr:hypothetical protein TWF132_010243 [Orbilia oligospora]